MKSAGSDTGGSYAPERWLLVAAALVIPALILEEAHDPGVRAAGLALDGLVWLAFCAELVALVRAAPTVRQGLRAHAGDLALVVLTPPLLPGPLQAVRLLRLLRLVRTARFACMLPRLLSLDGLRYVALLTGVVVIGGGLAFATVEHQQHLGAWDGIWWAITTVTTVGYGDITPKTDPGRVIAIAVMASGIGFVAMLTAALAQRFVHAKTEPDVMARLDEIGARLERLELMVSGGDHALPLAREGADSARHSTRSTRVSTTQDVQLDRRRLERVRNLPKRPPP